MELENCSSFSSTEETQVEPLSGAVMSADREAGPSEAPQPPSVPRVVWEDDTAEKHTKGRKFLAGFKRTWKKALKSSIQTQEETKVCAFVPEDPSEELPHSSSVDPTGTDPLESESTDNESLTPAVDIMFVPQPPSVPRAVWEDDTTEKHTKGRKFLAGFKRAWKKALKGSIQTQEETKVCAFVPEDPSEELPHTSSVDPKGTDPLESESTDNESLTPAVDIMFVPQPPSVPRAVWEDDTTEKHTKGRKFLAGFKRAWKALKGSIQTQEETKVCAFVPEDPSEELPHTSSVDPTGTDPLESESTDNESLTPAVDIMFVPQPPSVPRAVWEDDTTEKHTKGRKFLAGFKRAWKKALKGSIQTQEEPKVCAFVPEDPSEELPHTSSVDPTGTDPLESESTDRSFESLYKVGWKWNFPHRGNYYKGFRKSDKKRVIIKFIEKDQPKKLLQWPGYSKPLSREAAVILTMENTPASEHIVQLYDHFIMEDKDILIMKNLDSYIPLFQYLRLRKRSLTETEVRCIIRRLIVALQDCRDHGVYYKAEFKNVFVHKNSLHVKLIDFKCAHLIEKRREDESILFRKYVEWLLTDEIRYLLDVMVPRIRCWFWIQPRVSEECQDLLELLHSRESRMTLQRILDHDWFKRKTEE